MGTEGAGVIIQGGRRLDGRGRYKIKSKEIKAATVPVGAETDQDIDGAVFDCVSIGKAKRYDCSRSK